MGWLLKARRMNPRYHAAWRYLIAALALSGNVDEARSLAEAFIQRRPEIHRADFGAWYPLQQPHLDRVLGGLRLAGFHLSPASEMLVTMFDSKGNQHGEPSADRLVKAKAKAKVKAKAWAKAKVGVKAKAKVKVKAKARVKARGEGQAAGAWVGRIVAA